MKKLFVLILVVFLIVGTLVVTKISFKKNTLLEQTEENNFDLNEITIFGTHLNMSGCLNLELTDTLSLVLKNNDEEINIDSTFNNKDGQTCFNLSNKNNGGIFLEELKNGDYMLLVKQTIKNNDKETYKYYSIKNNTDYKNLEYYTITRNNKNNKININSNVDKKTNKNYIEFKINESKLPNDVYDITIDAGHWGYDPGSNYVLDGTTYYESNITLKIALLLKDRLEDMGLKVKMTRETDINVDPYGDMGRAVIPNEVNSKYSLSIHLNSDYGTMNYGGVEVYVPNNIDYDFAKTLVNNIGEVVGYSRKSTDRIDNGIYFTYFSKRDIEDSKNDMIDEGNKPYDIKEGAPYMYMIREVGGVNTYAYIDGRNEDYGLNKYYNSIQTAEPYLLELGYINYKSDLLKFVNNPEKFADAIANSINEYLHIS